RWPSSGRRDARQGHRVEDRVRETGLRVAMQEATLSRRGLVKVGLAAAAAFSLSRHARARAAPAEIKLPENIPVDRFDFETKGIEGWTTVDGQWAVEDMEIGRASCRESGYSAWE